MHTIIQCQLTTISAYDLLSNERQRRMYDSVDSVDDSVPAPAKQHEDFFAIFGPAFERNSRYLRNLPFWPELTALAAGWKSSQHLSLAIRTHLTKLLLPFISTGITPSHGVSLDMMTLVFFVSSFRYSF